MKNKTLKRIVSSILFIIGLILGFLWLGWKFIVVWFILAWANNIQMDCDIKDKYHLISIREKMKNEKQ